MKTKFIENQLYSIEMPGQSPFLAYYSCDTDPEDDYCCDICGTSGLERKHRMSVFVTTANNEIPAESASSSNITGQYFLGNSCIKKVKILKAN